MAAPDPEHVRRLTEEILRRPEFTGNSYRVELLKYLIEWFRKLGDWSGSHPGLATVLTIILFVILLGLITHIIYTVVTELRYVRKPNPRTSTSTSRALEDVADDWNSAARLAREALAAGDAYRAIWIAHRLLLDTLDRAGAIRFSRWKTNTDYLRECAAHAPQHGMLDEVTAVYDRVIYAHRVADLQAIAAILDRVELEHARA